MAGVIATLEPPGKWSAALDRLAGPHVLFLGRPESPYLQLGVAGIACGVAVLLGLALWTGASIAIAVALAVAAAATFVVAGLVRNALAGRASHVVLEDLVLVFAVDAVALWLLGEPVLVHLDLLAPALGAVLVLGRLGCLLCGCCHGRPARSGILYPAGAVAAPLAGIRLFPLQLVEAAWIAAMTAVAGSLVVAHAAPGDALWFWLLGYAAGRFVLELARGDVARPYLGPLSRTQWIAVALWAGRVLWEGATGAPVLRLAAAGGAAVLIVVGYATRRAWLDLPRPLITAADIRRWEAWAAALVDRGRIERDVSSETPSPGLTVALGADPSDDGAWLHAYTIARRGGTIERHEALAIAGFLAQRLPAHEIIRSHGCEHGRFHLWILIDRGAPSTSGADDPRLVLYRTQAFAGAIARLAATERSAHPPPPAAAPATPPPTAAAPPPTAAAPPPTAAPRPLAFLPAQLPLGYPLAATSDHEE